MGRRSIERGSKDTWKLTPKRIDALKAAGAASAQAAGPQAMGGAAVVGRGGQAVNGDLYAKVIEDPAFRDPRGYIISADQDDYPTVIKFIQVLQKGGIEVHRATASFTVAGKTYPTG